MIFLLDMDYKQLLDTQMKFIREARKREKHTEKIRRVAPRREPKVGRNAPCPCGSGKKYKKCHGRRG